MRKILLLGLAIFLLGGLRAQQTPIHPVRGSVTQSGDGTPLPGVNVVLKGSTLGTVTDTEGDFMLGLPAGDHVLRFSFIGLLTKELQVSVPLSGELTVSMEEDSRTLAEVTVVSTGFQELPAERATGSFFQADEKLLNRRVSTNVLDRLEDISPGLIFNRDRTDLDPGESISIRGNATLMGDRRPLVVVDGMIYDGPIDNLNPNDVESITVLRDAAAASIWGARAGNGVIVIQSKNGEFAQPMKLTLNSNITSGQAFDPFYLPQMDISAFVDVEQRLFEEGYYEYLYDSYDQRAVSPVVEDLYAHRAGDLSDPQLQARLQAYRTSDVRRDLAEYLYRPSLSQQYSLGLSGGSKAYSYLVSLGYDANRESAREKTRNRITLNTRQNWAFWKERADLELGTYLIANDGRDGFPETGSLNPYDLLADGEGNVLSVIRDYNPRFKERSMANGALDWNYFPLDEVGLSPLVRKDREARVNLRIALKLTEDFSFSSSYQFWLQNGFQEKVNSLETYRARNLINLYSQLSEEASPVYGIPPGGYRDYTDFRGFSHTWRNQLNFHKKYGRHEWNALAGFELRDFQTKANQNRSYGFDSDTGISQAVDYISFFPQLNTGWGAQVPYVQTASGNIDRFVSIFANMGYTFDERFLVTGSLRSDASNLYGVDTNQKRVPLWSAGLGWIMSQESWLKASWVDFLKIKASLGYNGNTNPAGTAYTTGTLFGSNTNPWVGQPWMSLLNPPNPQLRWEKIRIANLGVEWEFFSGRLTGSLEGYRKEGEDLYGMQPYFPSSGNHSVSRNYANTLTHGFDLSLTGEVISGPLRWSAFWFHSMVKEKVTHYANMPRPQNVASYSSGRSGVLPEPVEGYPLYSIFSYPFAGLDPQDGSPRGYLDGEPSTDYASILNQTSVEGLEFHGSAIPTHFGALRNQLIWKGWEFSANIAYRLGYWFRRESVNYTSLNRGNITHADYAHRWQQPGDEMTTDIPSDPLIVNETRTAFELVNASRVRRGDHVRFQDIQLAYTFGKAGHSRLPVESLRIYGYANNLGILWKSAKDVADPDFRNIQALTSYSLGINIQF